jgi:phosphate starvation-inducible protein PhoH and related proteins
MSRRSRRVEREDKPVKKAKFAERPHKIKQLAPMNIAQSYYMQDIEESIITFGIGSAGTGKTYISAAIAGKLLHEGKIRQIIITRPAIESGAKMGHLPGTLEEKFAPYLDPIKDVLISIFGKGWWESQLKNGNILPVPLAFMQGKTFDNAFVIADEMQNSTPNEMFMLLSRVGKYTKLVINGDYKMQKMINGMSGLEDGQRRLEGVEGVTTFEFTSDDIVRSGIAKEIIKRYENN